MKKNTKGAFENYQVHRRDKQKNRQTQIKNRSDDDYWNLSDNDSHKVK